MKTENTVETKNNANTNHLSNGTYMNIKRINKMKERYFRIANTAIFLLCVLFISELSCLIYLGNLLTSTVITAVITLASIVVGVISIIYLNISFAKMHNKITKKIEEMDKKKI